MIDFSKKMKLDIANNMKFPNLAGCSIFLQVSLKKPLVMFADDFVAVGMVLTFLFFIGIIP